MPPMLRGRTRLFAAAMLVAGSKLHEARMALWDRFFEVTLP